MRVIEIGLDRDGDHFGARDHDLAHERVAEIEDGVQDLLFFVLDNAPYGAGRDEHLEFFDGVHQFVPGGRRHAEQLEQRVTGPVQRPR